MTVIVRGKINKNNEWTEQQVIFRATPELYSSTNAHYGSRFIFDKQGHLFFTLGEKNDHGATRRICPSPLGKIHRVNDDGSVPKDNPFVNRPARSRRSGATAIAIRRVSRGIRSTASCGSRSTARRAATRSTSSSRATTTAGA